MKIFRQGDILLKETMNTPELENCIQSAEGDEIKNCIILALGEATGHKHQLIEQNCKLMKCINDKRFFLLVESPSDLVHEEHKKITIPKGKYEVIRQRTYHPDEIRTVLD